MEELKLATKKEAVCQEISYGVKLIVSVVIILGMMFFGPDIKGETGLIQNNSKWLSTDGQPIEARSGSILQIGNSYHWFGAERNGNNFEAINHYSSTNLENWKKNHQL